MNDWILALGLPLFGFVVGATPFGYLAGRLKGVDIRQHGSGNIGATNVLRTLGRAWGIPVFILDVLKGLFPVLVANHLAGAGSLISVATALAAIIGHNHTFWLRFKGGKGVATSAGAFLALVPLAVLVGAGVWILVFVVTRYVALASIAAAVAIPLSLLAEAVLDEGRSLPWPPFVLTLAVAVMVVVRHRTNIRRLLDGTEHRFERRRSRSRAAADVAAGQPADEGSGEGPDR